MGLCSSARKELSAWKQCVLAVVVVAILGPASRTSASSKPHTTEQCPGPV